MSGDPPPGDVTSTVSTPRVGRRRWVANAVGVVAGLGAFAAVAFALLDGPREPTVVAEPATLDETSVATDIAPPLAAVPSGTDVDVAPPTIGSSGDDTPVTTAASAEQPSSTSAEREQPVVTESVESASTDAEPAEPERRALPTQLLADGQEFHSFPIRSVGLEDNGELEVPDETEIGWYELGASPGERGAAVFAAHVSWNRTLGPFADLGSMKPGEAVAVVLDDGAVEQYVVTEVAVYPKKELPNERMWRNVGPEEVVLVTCGGEFDADRRRYRHNIVVYAAPRDDVAPAG